MKPTIVFCDFDGTIFDPDLRLLKAPIHNARSSKLLNRSDVIFVVTTGRHSWGPLTRAHYKLTGMRRADLIIAGAGTYIYWLRNGRYVLDADWDDRMKKNWDKPSILEKLESYFQKHHLGEFSVPNPYMIVVPLYGKTLDEAQSAHTELEAILKKNRATVVLSEQLMLPNSLKVFNGYALIVPDIAGKDKSAAHIVAHFAKELKSPLNMLAFGDACVDIPLLTMKAPANTTEFKSYGVHLTPLAERNVKAMVAANKAPTEPTLLYGSAPQAMHSVFKAYFKEARNSPYRSLIAPFESLIDKKIHPGMTPNELTEQGLKDVREGLKKGGLRGFATVTKGHLIDAADGIRARRHPELKTADGQLLDVAADRMKEFEELMARGRYAAALSCILPSIARAQAEALGVTVPELDAAGGSALSRTRLLLTSLFFHTVNMPNQSKKIDDTILKRNLQTFYNRRTAAEGFSWSPAKLKTYDKTAMERLLLLVGLLQKQYAEISKHQKIEMKELEEYTKLKLSALSKTSRT